MKEEIEKFKVIPKDYDFKLGFNLVPINHSDDINDKLIDTKDLYIKRFLKSKNIITYGDLSRLNKNELLLIKSAGPRRIEKFIQELAKKTITLKANNNFTTSKRISELKLSKKFLKYCKLNNFVYLVQMNNIDFLDILLREKITMSDIKVLLSQEREDNIEKTSNEARFINQLLPLITNNKVKVIMIDVINDYKIENIEQLDYKTLFKYNLTSNIAKEITNLLARNNYKFYNEILPIYQFNPKKKIADFFKKKSEQHILKAMEDDGIKYISDLVNTNLLNYIVKYDDSCKIYDFIKQVFVIKHINHFDFNSMKIIDKDIYEFLTQKNIRKIEEIDFIELFKKFDNMKFLNLIKQIDNKYMRSNYTLYIYKKLFELKQNEDVVNILYRTIVNHETLESIGSGIGVSKERIRQRRQKAKETFNEYVELLKDFLKVKYAKQKYFDLNSLNEIYKDEDAIVLEELLKEKNLDFIDEIDVFAFYKADKIIDTYKIIMQELGDIFEYSEQIENIDNMLEEYGIDFLPIEKFEYFLKINNYKLINDIYCKKDTKVALFDYIIRKYYKSEFYINDNFISHLINSIHKIFGKKLVFSENLHNIKSILLRDDDIILCGNNRYIHIINVKLDKRLIKNINKKLHNLLEKKENIYIKNIYEEYKEELLKMTSINNELFLYGILKHFYKDEFNFNRFNISKNEKEHNSKVEKIEKFVEDFKKPIERKKLQEKFDLNRENLSNIIEISDSLYYCDKNTKIANIKNLDISETLEEKIISKINLSMQQGFVSIHYLYKSLELDFIEEGISDSDTLYNILKLKYNKDFNFKKPYIVSLDVDMNKFNEKYVINKYFESFNYISRDDFIKFINEMQYKHSVANNVIKQLQSYFFQIDVDIYIKPNSLSITVEQLNKIKEFLKIKFNKEDYLALKEIEEDMEVLPVIDNYTWNQYFLKSIMNEYFNEDYLEIDRDVKSWKYYNPIFVKKDSNIESFNDLIIDVILKKNKKPIINYDELNKILIQNNLIISIIPREFFRDERVIFENNIIKIREKK